MKTKSRLCFAITVNRERIVVYCLLTEDTDNAAVVASSLAWSEDIEISKCRGLEVIEVVILFGIVIDRVCQARRARSVFWSRFL